MLHHSARWQQKSPQKEPRLPRGGGAVVVGLLVALVGWVVVGLVRSHVLALELRSTEQGGGDVMLLVVVVVVQVRKWHHVVVVILRWVVVESLGAEIARTQPP